MQALSWRWLPKICCLCPLSNHDHPDRFAKCWDSTKEMNNVLRAQRSVDMGSLGGDRGCRLGVTSFVNARQASPPFFLDCVPPTTAPSLFQSESGVCCVGPDSKPDCQCFQNSREIQKSWDIVILFPSQIKKAVQLKQTRAKKNNIHGWGPFFWWDGFLWELWRENDVFLLVLPDDKSPMRNIS
jgi:hypothetical protein